MAGSAPRLSARRIRQAQLQLECPVWGKAPLSLEIRENDAPTRFRQARKVTPRQKLLMTVSIVLGSAIALWWWRTSEEAPKVAGARVVPVVSTTVSTRNMPVRLTSNGTVSPLQSVDVRAQIAATVKAVHIREGQSVKAGAPLFSLDVRTEAANLGKSEAQITKTRADLANAERNLARQRELFSQKFISQTALDTVQNQVESLRAQLAADQAAAQASRVARGFGDIVAPITGRLGAVNIYPGSLVQPGGAALVSLTQIDPINISFTVPDRELPALQAAQSHGPIAVQARIDAKSTRAGTLVFIDNAVDSASGTIRLKATFDNADGRLWPGMFVNVELSPRQLADALVVPAQAVQTGPEKKFVYVIDTESKVSAVPVRVVLLQDGNAVVEGLAADARIVVEGAQNLRPGSKVSEGKTAPTGATPKANKT